MRAALQNEFSRSFGTLAIALTSALLSGLPVAHGGCTAIVAGTDRSLALMGDGSVWAWGGNGQGQLGNGTTASSSLPVQVKDPAGTGFLTGVTAIDAGSEHSLALSGGGSVWAWGANRFGELGNGTTTSSSLPVQVKDPGGTGFLTGVTALAAGNHSLALKGDGSVWAWGNNSEGGLGNGTTIDSSLPVQVKDPAGTGFLTGVIAIASGSGHSLALKGDGFVWAWGRNVWGQLGNGTTIDSSLPVQVKDPAGTGFLTGVTALAAGTHHSQALMGDGSVWAWGKNGALFSTGTSLPVQVEDPAGTGFLTGVTAIAAGTEYSLALMGDGSVWAWGGNAWGQLGNGTTTSSSLPVQVKDAAGTGFLTGVTAIASGNHSLALKDDGSVWAWGDNVRGQLGNGTTTDSSLPVQSSINLGQSAVPPDQGNVLLAVKGGNGADVVLSWMGTGTSSFGVYRDPAKDQLGRTLLLPTVTAPGFVDAGRVSVMGSDFYRVKGLSACGAGL